ncbi:stalk domain-containing protein [Paenibacillus pinihumi]|uniref:stalk domain-containing protein n=1 Tax=Paenibacillus pinihumi TaxID=669462 RepID=UPI000429559F|nr:stalk domain-containing protein [Paenibacillus pinihumi]
MRIATLTVSMLLAAILISPAAYASTAVSKLSGHPAAADYAVVRVDQHQLMMSRDEAKSTFDGKPLFSDPILIRNQMVYFPVRTLEKLGAAQIDWVPEQQQANIISVQALQTSVKDLGVRARTKLLYNLDGAKLNTMKASQEPFIQKGRMYVPIDLLSTIGFQVRYNKGKLTAEWSNKRIEIGETRLHTDESTAHIDILYEKQLIKPVLLKSGAEGTAIALAGEIKDIDVKSGNKYYNRIRFELELEAGLNAYELGLIGERVFFTIERNVIPAMEIKPRLTEEGQNYLSLHPSAEPAKTLHAGDSLRVSGEIATAAPAMTVLQLHISRYNGKSFELAESYSIPVRDRKFEYEYALKKKGDYIVQLISSPYTKPTGQEPASVVWAEWKTAVQS